MVSVAGEQKGRQAQQPVQYQFVSDTRGGNQIMLYSWGECPYAVESQVGSHALRIDMALSGHSEQLWVQLEVVSNPLACVAACCYPT